MNKAARAYWDEYLPGAPALLNVYDLLVERSSLCR